MVLLARWMTAEFAALALVLASGCILEPIDTTAKECPCAPGFECVSNRCVQGSACEPAVRVDNFRATWAAPNVIRWDWEPSGDRTRFVRYEMHVAERPEDLATDAAIVFGPEQNPELGGYVLARTGGGDDVVTHTMTDGHAPRTTYAGQLVAIDASFCEFRSDVAAVTTSLEPPEEVVLFRDETSPGGPLPSTLRVIDDGEGNRVLEHVPADDPECVMSGDGVCGQNLRWISIGASLAAITDGEFTNTAILEARVSNDTDTPSFFSRVWIQLDDSRVFRMEPFTIRSGGGYRVIQVPLRALVTDGSAQLVLGDLTSTVGEANVGGQWSRTSPTGQGRVLVDEIRVRY